MSCGRLAPGFAYRRRQDEGGQAGGDSSQPEDPVEEDEGGWGRTDAKTAEAWPAGPGGMFSKRYGVTIWRLLQVGTPLLNAPLQSG